MAYNASVSQPSVKLAGVLTNRQQHCANVLHATHVAESSYFDVSSSRLLHIVRTSQHVTNNTKEFYAPTSPSAMCSIDIKSTSFIAFTSQIPPPLATIRGLSLAPSLHQTCAVASIYARQNSYPASVWFLGGLLDQLYESSQQHYKYMERQNVDKEASFLVCRFDRHLESVSGNVGRCSSSQLPPAAAVGSLAVTVDTDAIIAGRNVWTINVFRRWTTDTSE